MFYNIILDTINLLNLSLSFKTVWCSSLGFDITSSLLGPWIVCINKLVD